MGRVEAEALPPVAAVARLPAVDGGRDLHAAT